jgi:peptidoglycan/xylan/chitin deacetylase (PgdA/CDA1 family)
MENFRQPDRKSRKEMSMIQRTEMDLQSVGRELYPTSKANYGPLQPLTGESGISVFHFHGVVEKKRDWLLERNFHLLRDFRQHIRFLRKYRVLSLAEVVHEMDSPSKSSAARAVITFDDGYANNLLPCEILTEARMPMSVFIPTNVVGRDHAIWTVELRLLLLYGLSSHVVAFDRVWILNSRTRRKIAFRTISRAMKKLPAAIRQRIMENIRQQFPVQETQRLLNVFPSLQMLSWQEIEHMESAGVEIGSHGADHEIHHESQPISVRAHEMRVSKVELERRLRTTCRYFAFPDGTHVATSDDEVQMAGYDLAFTTRPGPVHFGSNKFLLPRVVPVLTRRTIALNFVRKRVDDLLAIRESVRRVCVTPML